MGFMDMFNGNSLKTAQDKMAGSGPPELDFTDMLAINIGNKLMGKGGGGAQQMQTPQAQIPQMQQLQMPNMMTQQGQWQAPQLQGGLQGGINKGMGQQELYPQKRASLFSMLRGGQ
jgi:hypothetical protein